MSTNNMIPQYKIDGLGAEYKKTEELEKRIADFLGVKYCVMTSSGTAALFLAIRAMEWQSANVPALTMIATANALQLAASPEYFDVGFYDVEPKEENYMDGTIHVSLNGRGNGVENIKTPFIEDACQSFGSMHNGKYLGTFGAIGCFSFSPQKIMTSGAGGCCVTNDEGLANKIRKLKNFGRLGGGDIHDEIGYNFKFTDIQAEILLKQMDDIYQRIETKKWIYSEYQKRIGQYMLEHKGTPWMVDIYVNNRNELSQYLLENEVMTRNMYPIIPRQKPYLDEQEYPISETMSTHGLWLPSSPDITIQEIDTVCNLINKFYEE